MTNPQPSLPRFLHVSLRELLLGLGFLALGCAALKYAGEVWWTVLATGTLLAFLAAAVAAAVDRGRRQAWAVGFLVCAGVYGVLLWAAPTIGSGDSRELDHYSGRLPTTKLLKPLFEAMVTRTWIDVNTGQPIPIYDPQQAVFGPSGIALLGGVGVRESPERAQFLAIGHLLWALLLGYLGGRWAEWLYLCRTSGD